MTAVPAMVVLTPSHAPDLELCRDLNASVLAYAPAGVRHHIVVPRADVAAFAPLAGGRTVITDERSLLPRSFVRPPGLKYTVNLRRPVPPVRGWILQQVVKLAAVARSEADVVLLVDSDIVFVRPFTAADFVRAGVVRFYRKPDEVTDRLPRHLIWHRVARQLLGLPPGAPPYPDYVSSLLAWDPAIMRAALARVESVTGRRWADAVAGQLHFSEWTLYGVFVDAVLGEPGFTSADTRCHSHWDEIPLDTGTAAQFVGATRPTDLAVMISAKSRTPLAVRRAAFQRTLT